MQMIIKVYASFSYLLQYFLSGFVCSVILSLGIIYRSILFSLVLEKEYRMSANKIYKESICKD